MIVLMREGEAAGVGRKGTTEESGRKTAASREFRRLFGSRQPVLLSHQLSSDATSKQGFFSVSLSLSSEHRSGVYCVCDFVWLFQLHSHNSIMSHILAIWICFFPLLIFQSLNYFALFGCRETR
ncbi:hypothetical protein PRUPE_8G201600 [Prunus persica]|uniref:Uncharacterized protein n=1 Tax=Prunus persica TaxID=3760 RepID=A0A251N0L0_PRUPE|nr:hypothetical protein PRUPE_8G201600 [Prunus persica]